MSSITIRNLDVELKARLRLRAARHGLSMEQEVRNILQRTLAGESTSTSGLDFATRIHQRFKGLEAEHIVMPSRQPAKPVPDFDPS